MNTTPIAFMAWTGKELLSGNNFAVFGDGAKYKLDQSHGWSCGRSHIENSSFKLMQLTALRSINDEPIYNHMIVKGESSTLYEIDMFDYAKMAMLSNLNLEIVGNRFQSPELLELCK